MVEVAYPLQSLVTKSAEGRLKGVDVENRIVPGYISTPTIDRDKEFVPVDAFTQDLDIYKSNPILLLHHAHKSLPVGKAVKLEFDDKGLYAEYYIAKTPLGDEVLSLCAEGILRGFSTGFMPIDFRLNPQDYELPVAARGKGCKKMYKRVELVEVSLLAIPSNRTALITQVEKGNKAAELVVKSFDAESNDEDITHVLKAWMGTVNKYFWDETEHPRDTEGQFTDADNYSGLEQYGAEREAPQRYTLAQQMQQLSQNQQEIRASLEQINDKDSWSAWAKKWAIRGGVIAGIYAFFKSKTGKRLSARATAHALDWLKGKALSAVKEVSDPDLAQVRLVTDMLDQIRVAMKKGKALGLSPQNSPELAEMAGQYTKIKATLAKLAHDAPQKGLGDIYVTYKDRDMITKSLGEMLHVYENGTFGGLIKSVEGDSFGLKGIFDVVTKESAESFRKNEMEGDHPRDQSGKFTDSGSAPEAPKPKSRQLLGGTEPIIGKPKSHLRHGGKRVGAGRWPNNADEAVAKLRKRFAEYEPDMSKEEVDNEILRMAEDKAKPDVIRYLKDPDRYWKERARQAVLLQADKHRKAAFGRGWLTGYDTHFDTSVLRKNMRISERKFKKEVQKQRSLVEAHETLRDQMAPQNEKNNAIALLAIANIVGALGVGALMLHRPSHMDQNIKWIGRFGAKQMDELVNLSKSRIKNTLAGKPGFAPDINIGESTMEWLRGHNQPKDILQFPNLEWLRVIKLAGGDFPKRSKAFDDVVLNRLVTDREAGRINGVMNRVMKKILPKKYADLPAGPYTTVAGEKATGVGVASRFQPGDYFTFDRAKSRYGPAQWGEDDVDMVSGLKLFVRRKKIEVPHALDQKTAVRLTLDRQNFANYKLLWMTKNAKGEPIGRPASWLRERGMDYTADGIGPDNAWKYYKTTSEPIRVVDTDKFNAFFDRRMSSMGHKKTAYKSGNATIHDYSPQVYESLLPRAVSKKVDLNSDEMKYLRATFKLGDKDEVTLNQLSWWTTTIQPMLNRKILARLAAYGILTGDLAYVFADELSEIPAAYYSSQRGMVSRGEQREKLRKWHLDKRSQKPPTYEELEPETPAGEGADAQTEYCSTCDRNVTAKDKEECERANCPYRPPGESYGAGGGGGGGGGGEPQKPQFTVVPPKKSRTVELTAQDEEDLDYKHEQWRRAGHQHERATRAMAVPMSQWKAEGSDRDKRYENIFRQMVLQEEAKHMSGNEDDKLPVKYRRGKYIKYGGLRLEAYRQSQKLGVEELAQKEGQVDQLLKVQDEQMKAEYRREVQEDNIPEVQEDNIPEVREGPHPAVIGGEETVVDDIEDYVGDVGVIGKPPAKGKEDKRIYYDALSGTLGKEDRKQDAHFGEWGKAGEGYEVLKPKEQLEKEKLDNVIAENIETLPEIPPETVVEDVAEKPKSATPIKDKVTAAWKARLAADKQKPVAPATPATPVTPATPAKQSKKTPPGTTVLRKRGGKTEAVVPPPGANLSSAARNTAKAKAKHLYQKADGEISNKELAKKIESIAGVKGKISKRELSQAIAFWKKSEEWSKEAPAAAPSNKNKAKKGKKANPELLKPKEEQRPTRKRTRNKGLGFDIITKAINEANESGNPLNVEHLTDLLAEDISKMFEDISIACHDAVRSGMPGSEAYARIHDVLVMTYQMIKARARAEEEMGLKTSTIEGV